MHEQLENVVYEFDGFTVDAQRRQLLKAGGQVPLTAKAFETLSFLVRNQGVTVSKAELMNAVWADSAVEENNLTQQISTLRRVLGERPGDHRFIVTVPGRGYCFVAELNAEVRAESLSYARVATGSSSRFDPAVVRGYSLAIGQILLVCLAFLFSALTEPVPGRPQSLAVLNFRVSTSGDEFIGNGISETLRARLGSVEDLTLRPAVAGHDPLDAGRRLHVETVVTGSVQRENDRIRVSVEMLDVADGRIVWGKTFDDAASNIFALQDAIAGEVARALNVKFSSRETGPAPGRRLVRPREPIHIRRILSA